MSRGLFLKVLHRRCRDSPKSRLVREKEEGPGLSVTAWAEWQEIEKPRVWWGWAISNASDGLILASCFSLEARWHLWGSRVAAPSAHSAFLIVLRSPRVPLSSQSRLLPSTGHAGPELCSTPVLTHPSNHTGKTLLPDEVTSDVLGVRISPKFNP